MASSSSVLTKSSLLRGEALLTWLASHAPEDRDRVFEQALGIGIGIGTADEGLVSLAELGPGAIGYHASGVAPIVRAVFEVPIAESDVVIDLGAGLGKVACLAHLLTGARARGIELQERLVARAEASVAGLGLEHAVTIVWGDAREAFLEDGTVFYLYLPFVGEVLDAVLARLRRVAEHHAIVVVTLGVSLEHVPWLTPRKSDAFWLEIYESGQTRPRTPPCSAAALAVMHETTFSMGS